MSIDFKINELLDKEFETIDDEIVRKICRLSVNFAQNGSNKGVHDVPKFVSDCLDSQLTSIFREMKR
jgi:hypothetical protein